MEKLNKLRVFYPVLSIIRDELERHLEYFIEKDIVIITENGNEISRINVHNFLEQSKVLFSYIQQGSKGDGAFEIPAIDNFLNQIHCKKVKAKSHDKADIHIVIHDYHTGMEPNLGFSIKSDGKSAPSIIECLQTHHFCF